MVSKIFRNTILVLVLKTHVHADFLLTCSSSLSWLQTFDAHLKKRTNKLQFSIYSVQVNEVKLSQTFIFGEDQEIFTTHS